jgi:hypothetical protein
MDCIEQTYIQGPASKSWIRLLVLSACLMGLSHLHAASGSDNADNYSTWSSGDIQGTGFGPWNLVQVNGGWFLGDPSSRASNLSSLVTSGKTFGLYASGFVDAVRSFEPALATNDRFKISLGYQWDNGNRGFSLYNGTSEVLNFNINDQGMSWTGGGTYPAIPWDGKRVNGIQVDITIIKTTNGFRFAITSPQESGINGAGSVTTSGVTSFKIYVSGSGGGSGGDFNFNNLLLDSIPGDVTPPDMTLNGDKLVQVAVGETYTPPDPAVAVSDDVTSSANIMVTASPLDTSTAGLKTITYTARDEANNDATVTRVVIVGDLTATTADTYYNLHSPATLTLNPTSSRSVYGQIYLKGATPGAGQTPNIQAWIGVNSDNTDPSTWSDTAWKSAAYNSGQTGNNDEYSAQLTGADYATGNTYYYATRWKVGSGAYAYGGTTGPWNGTTSMSGVLTVEGARTLTFAVNMNVQTTKSFFDPASQGVEVRGSFNSWAGGVGTLTDLDSDGIYTGSFTVSGDLGASIEYKFYRTGSNGAGYEGLADNRTLTLGADGVNSTIATAFFNNDDGIGPVISIIGDNPLNLNVADTYTELGATATDLIDGNRTVTPSGTVNTAVANTYTITYNASDVAGNAGTPVTRTVVVAAPVGSTFAGWSGGATATPELVGKYAIGGGSDPSAQGEAPTVGKRFIVPNHYTYIEAIVRTDDNKLSFLAESSTDLSSGFSSTGTWTVEGAGQSVSQINVPTGCERKRFIYWHGMAQEKMFLRLRVTLAP